MTETTRLLGGRYELGDVLGRGGMAEVHIGRDIRLGRDVAVKMLRADLARDPSFQARFRREAQSAASLNHPAIVAVYDTGEDDASTAARCRTSSWSTSRADAARPARVRAAGCCPSARWRSSTAVLAALEYSHRAGHHPPRHQAGERDAHAGRRRQGDGLRHRPRDGRHVAPR